jgi:hypothetical protein
LKILKLAKNVRLKFIDMMLMILITTYIAKIAIILKTHNLF